MPFSEMLLPSSDNRVNFETKEFNITGHWLAFPRCMGDMAEVYSRTNYSGGGGFRNSGCVGGGGGDCIVVPYSAERDPK